MFTTDMERIRVYNDLQYQVSDEPIILSKPLLDLLLKESDPSNLIALYSFYYYTSKWQKTNRPRATTAYVANGLNWSIEKVRKVKQRLLQLNLISDITIVNETTGLISGHYIQVNFLFQNQIRTQNPEGGSIHGVDNPSVNALNPNNKKPLRADDDFVTPAMFENFWKLYPKKIDKGKALNKWNNVCKRTKDNRPTWKEIHKAILKQIKSDRWKDPKFIPHPTTWLNQSRWLDDPKQMVSYDRTDKTRYKEFEGMRYYICPDGEYRNEAGDKWYD